MIIEFSKYQGAGNDFIIIDGRGNPLFNSEKDLSGIVKKLCNRNFGIGADGLIIVRNGKETELSMQYFNSDGREGTMCGNGGRCFAAFARELGFKCDEISFEAIDGIHTAKIIGNHLGVYVVSLSMIDVEEITKLPEGIFLNTGSPHLVVFRRDISKINVIAEGRKLRYSNSFSPNGVNVNFVEVAGSKSIKVRTYERGVENETLSCGTGVVAAAIATRYFAANKHSNYFQVEALGGNLEVSFETENNKVFKNVWLKGLAEKVFEGKVEFN